MRVQSEILSNMYTAVNVFAQAQNLRVAHRNRNFDKDSVPSRPYNRAMYLKPEVLTVPPDPRAVNNGQSFRQWLGRVLVYARSGIGEVIPARVADALALEFPHNRKFVGAERSYQIVEEASPRSSVDGEEGWIFIPVECRITAVY